MKYVSVRMLTRETIVKIEELEYFELSWKNLLYTCTLHDTYTWYVDGECKTILNPYNINWNLIIFGI